MLTSSDGKDDFSLKRKITLNILRNQQLSVSDYCLELADFFYFAESEFSENKNLQTRKLCLLKIEVPCLL